MAGDNNLSENMAVALDEINRATTSVKAGSAQSQVNLLTYFDGNSLTAPTQYIDFSDVTADNPKPIREKMRLKPYPKEDTRRDKNKKVSDDDVAEGNAASAYSILNFVNWCINTQNRKAKNYAIIFSGHSFGFHGTSFLRDESAGGYITLFKFRWALEQIKKDLLNDQKISILGFDSCVMSMLEVGYELNKVAETMVASEGSLPNSGWSYAPLLKRFLPDEKQRFQKELTTALHNKDLGALEQFLRSKNINPQILQAFTPLIMPLANEPQVTKSVAVIDEIDAAQVMDIIVAEPGFIKEAAKNFVADLIIHHNNLLIGGRSIDVTAWDLNEVRSVVENLDLLAKEFNRRLDLSKKIEMLNDPKNTDENTKLQDTDIEIFQELKKIILQSHYDSQTYMNEQCVDLMDFCKRFIIECKFMERGENEQIYTNFIKLAKNVITSVKTCILKSGFSGDEYQFSNGISVYFPWSNLTFGLTNYRYRYLNFCKGINSQALDIEKPDTYDGLGKNWYLFLRNYIFRVTMRQLRKEIIEIEGKDTTFTSVLDDFSKSNPVWSKSNPVWSKSNPVWSKSNPDASRSNPPWSRSNPDASKSNPDASKSNPDASRGDFGNYLFYFSRFKNFQNQWDISGFSDDFMFETDFDEAEALLNNE